MSRTTTRRTRRRRLLPVRALRRDERHAWEHPLPLDPLFGTDPEEHLEGPKRWYGRIRGHGVPATPR